MLYVKYSSQEINPGDFLIFNNHQGLDIATKIDLDTFPGVLQKQENLQWISNVDNNIRVVTKEIYNFEYLNSITLNNNKLNKLPDFNEVNTSLISLQLYSNDLKEIPESIGKLEALNTFLASDNLLTNLPDRYLRFGTSLGFRCFI